MNFFEKAYFWVWHDFICRWEPWSDQWRRHVKKWWRLDLAVGIIIAGTLLWVLLFPLSNAPVWAKVLTIITLVLVVAFFGWLLLHLGGFAKKLFRR